MTNRRHNNPMTSIGPDRPRLLRGIIRDFFLLVLAEVVVLGLAWYLSPRGKAMLARLFRGKHAANRTNPAPPTTIDV